MRRTRRLAVVFTVMLVTALMLSVTAFASVDSDNGGFSLWNLLDGISGFFRDVINAVGGFFTGLISAIGKAFDFLLSGLKKLFIPSKESFSRFRDDILDTFDSKLGSVFSALNYLSNRFRNLNAKVGLTESFKITFPRNSFLYGLSFDLLVAPYDVIMFIRLCITGFYCVITALICYRKVIAMVNK